MMQALPYADVVVPGLLEVAGTGIPWFAMPYARTDVARNLAAEELLSSDYTHLLMLDSDQVHSAAEVMQLISRVVTDPEKQVIGGLYFRRGGLNEPLAFVKRDDGYHYIADWKDGIFEVDIIGTGCILIDRRVFEALPRPYFAYSYDAAANIPAEYPTEDVFFCQAARAAGIKIWVDTLARSDHMTNARIDETTYRQQAGKEGN
jgi:hypothetical protein